MGMFDYVTVRCPACGVAIHAQSKGGDCLLNDIPFHEADARVLADMDGDTLVCSGCNARWTVKVHAVATLLRSA